MSTEYLLDFTINCTCYLNDSEGDVEEKHFHKLTKEFMEFFIGEEIGLDKCLVQNLKLCKRNSPDEDWAIIKQF